LTPLALALARAPRLARRVVIDERSAGFVALGAARASGQPAALICTSGTAPAHYAPAVIEASLAGVPLLVVSADRPTALHGAGASQTIDQQRLFGGFVRRFDDLGVADGGAVALAAARRKVFQAVLAARGPLPGPAHVNVPLVKPLEPAAPTTAAERAAVAEVARLIALPPPVAAPSRCGSPTPRWPTPPRASPRRRAGDPRPPPPSPAPPTAPPWPRWPAPPATRSSPRPAASCGSRRARPTSS
jgi:2-succinyl-5-enolpyruvyl-6-hydroxy-3-cyclohexene-1-carboxylate synthase